MAMWCQYIRLPDNRLRCPNCGDETTRIWLAPPEKWPQRPCHTRTEAGRLCILGVGDYLAQLLQLLGVKPKKGCGCGEMMHRMNAWGTEGCYHHRKEIAQQLKKGYQNTSYSELSAALAKSVTTRLAFKLPWCSPLLGLVDEAIRLKATEVQPELLLSPRP